MEDSGWVLLQQAEEKMKEGRRQSALPLLASHLQKSPDSARGWWLLSLAVSDPKQQIDCLERVLKIDPEYAPARTRLDTLRGVSKASKPIVPPFTEQIDTPAQDIKKEILNPSQPVAVAQTDAKVSADVPKKTSPSTALRKSKNRTAQFVVLGMMSVIALVVVGFGGVMFFQGINSASPTIADPQSSFTQIMLPPTWTPTVASTLAPTQTAVPTNTSLPVSPTADILQTSVAKSLIGASVGYFAPDFSLANVTTGETVSLSAYKGRPVLVLFWATWCPYCEAQIADLVSVYDNYQDDGFEVLAVDVDEGAGMARRYKQSHTMKYVILDDFDRAVSDRYSVNAFPRLFFIEPSGKISFIGIGLMEKGSLEQEVQKIVEMAQ